MTSKVLIVEDDEIVRQVHKAMLMKLGCKVDVVTDGNSAIEKAKGIAYDLIMIDLGLPDIPGFEVIAKLHADPLQKAILIAVTGYTDQADKQACLKAGVNEVLNKPVVINTMRDVLNRYVS